jgi:hypothetical protein
MGITKPIDHQIHAKEGENMNPLYVGIDVSSRTNVVYLMGPDGSKRSNFSVPNNRDGSRQLVKRIVAEAIAESLSDLVIRSSLSAFLTTRISTDAIWLKSSIYKVFLQTVISFSK